MKKMMAIIPAVFLAIGAGTGTAAAQAAGKPGAPAANAPEACRCFVDRNDDGICDNRNAEQCPQNGMGNGHHRRNGCFADADNGGRNQRNRGARFGGNGHRHRR